MTSQTALEALEKAVMDAAPDDAPALSSILPDDAPPPLPGADTFDAAPALDLIDPETFGEQWGQIHDLMGGMVQMRTGRACPLGDQARSAGGQMAGQAVYGLLASTPVLARMFLSPQSTFIGQVMVIGMHGFACVQIVRAANDPTAPTEAAQ